MIERVPRPVLIAGVLLAIPALAYIAYSRPWYFTSQSYMVQLISLEVLLLAIWMYRKVFFPLVLVTFLFAGINLPVGTGWTAARWAVLGLGVLVGSLIMIRERQQSFGLFHAVAFFAVLAALVSAAVSLYPDIALLKVLSILLLFGYAATGVRVAAIGRENNFFRGLLLGTEILVGANFLFYAVGIEAMGNPNSLGAVMCIVGAPILLWGVLIDGNRNLYRRRLLLYGLCMYLVFLSHSRAGIATALLCSTMFCVLVRKYKLLMQGAITLGILLAAVGLFRPTAISSLTSSVLYKNNSGTLFASRISPWQSAMDNIREHPWFGMGLGTTANGTDADDGQPSVASTGAVTAEHGSSYLAILAGVGVVGAIPFALLLALLIANVVRTILFLREPGRVGHPAVVLAIVMVAGMLHAAFEDWMFAPGNYICVFFWTFAFLFNDLAPVPTPLGLSRKLWRVQGTMAPIAPSS